MKRDRGRGGGRDSRHGMFSRNACAKIRGAGLFSMFRDVRPFDIL